MWNLSDDADLVGKVQWIIILGESDVSLLLSERGDHSVDSSDLDIV
jgi:hypothetical protein